MTPMKITRISAYRLELPFRDGPYTVSGGRTSYGFDSTVIRIDTDEGLTGWGEMAPLGTTYDPSFAAGARAAVAEIAPSLIGEDPRQHRAIYRRMLAALKGHPYARSAIDMACWDLAGKSAGLPLAEALGGRFGDGVALYRSISKDAPDKMARKAEAYVAAGYTRLQVKVGGDPNQDVESMTAVIEAVGSGVPLFADANGGWARGDALRFLRATRNLDFYLEQPCADYEDCLALKPYCDRPMVLDESIDSLRSLLRVDHDKSAEGITIKLARVGGITPGKAIRDLAVDIGLSVTVEDTGGSDIDTAAMVHLSLSTPAERRFHTVDFNNWVTLSNASGMPAPVSGLMSAPTAPGLGLTVREELFKEPFFTT